tara:strand:+ start:278 stop:469 length:192 start_codon:yes stop_codon:yes gene_type:complete
MYPDLTKEELLVLRNHLVRGLKHYRHSPREWSFWGEVFPLDELDKILKKINICLQQEETNEVI